MRFDANANKDPLICNTLCMAHNMFRWINQQQYRATAHVNPIYSECLEDTEGETLCVTFTLPARV